MSSGSNDTTIWKLKKVKAIDPIIDDAVKSLAKLEIIKYVRVTDNSIQASNEFAGNKRKLPVTEPFHPTAVGIYLLYGFEYKVMQIMEINSAVRGHGKGLG